MTKLMPNKCTVVALGLSAKHTFSKTSYDSITLLENLGVQGDAHSGVTVKHRSRVRADPSQPNLRQVHLFQEETLHELQNRGFDVAPTVLGENITTRGMNLLDLPRGTRLVCGSNAVIELTGLRNPCSQLDDYADGLMSALLDRSASGKLIRKAGVMGIVIESGIVSVGDAIEFSMPDKPHVKLERI